MVGLLAAWSVLLAVAGAGKMLWPVPAAEALRATGVPLAGLLGARPVVRLTGIFEIIIAAAVFGWGGRLPAILLAVAYLALALIAWRMLRVSPGQDCGCFGRRAEPITRQHLVVNAIGVLIGSAGGYWPQPSVLAEFVDQDATGRILLLVLIGLLTWLCYLTMTALPHLLEQRQRLSNPARDTPKVTQR